jgi:hypothetical protein
MAGTHVISALVDKRARLDGEIKSRRFQIMRLEAEMAHVDAVIRMFNPSYDISKIATKRSFGKNPAGTKKGDGVRMALTVLREASEPLTTNEIAARVLAKLGKPETPEALAMLATNIKGNFSRRRDGAVQLDATSYPGRWTMGRPATAPRPLEGE